MTYIVSKIHNFQVVFIFQPIFIRLGGLWNRQRIGVKQPADTREIKLLEIGA